VRLLAVEEWVEVKEAAKEEKQRSRVKRSKPLVKKIA
jgi:hypothetical protein